MTPSTVSEAVVLTSDSTLKPSTPLDLSPESIRHAGNALFVLWLKIAATLLAARLLVLIWPVLVLLILSLMLVATFNPLVRRLQARVKRSYAITTVVFTALTLGAGMFALMVPPLVRQARNLMTKLPQYLTQMETAARNAGVKVHLHGSSLDLSQQAASLGPETFNVLLSVFSGIVGMMTVAVLTTYLLIGGSKVSTSDLGLLPRHHRLPVRQMFAEIGLQVGFTLCGLAAGW